jgi:nitrogen fixation protein NifU and related proteins
MYSPKLLDHFEHPRNSGELPEARVRVRVENPVCADVLELAIVVRHDVIEEIAFKAKGCVPAIACASAMTELERGRAVSDGVSVEEICEAVGGLPAASSHAAQLAVDALAAALRESAKLENPVAHGA